MTPDGSKLSGSVSLGETRLEETNGKNGKKKDSEHFEENGSLKLSKIKIEKLDSVISKKRTDVIKWNGWGYNDSQFVINDEIITFTGKRYPIGDVSLPYFTQWAKDKLNINVSNFKHLNGVDRASFAPPLEKLPKPIINEVFLHEIKERNLDYSLDELDRLVRSHGQTLNDIYILRKNNDCMPRVPDIIIWPVSHEEVVEIVKLANEHNVVIIPYGGGTSVSGAITCPEEEQRCICSLDTSQMNHVLWIDEKNLLVCCESGIIGQDLESFLQKKGYTCGHEPDSYEFSTVGGWVATRASGMKKNVYGNIEDLLVGVQFITPKGVLCKKGLYPRQSTGPDLNHVVLGSEGTLGVVTEVILKIRPLAEVRKYGSIVFPYFEPGVNFMREVARQRCQPASIRLMDNEQFCFGQALRTEGHSYWESFTDSIKMKYLQYIKCFDFNKICVVTLLFEGNKESVEQQEKVIYKIAKQFGGLPAGEKNGERGYMLTFVIAYIRDLGLDCNVVAESFETSVPWDRTLTVCRNVKHIITEKCKIYGIKWFLISHRVTQTYDCGSCVYFYFGFNWEGLSDPLKVYSRIEEDARAEILRSGGSLSHHHGVGKLRARWYPSQVSHLGASVYSNTKEFLDPKNIFASRNLLPLKSHL